jgi:hypothetical protein
MGGREDISILYTRIAQQKIAESRAPERDIEAKMKIINDFPEIQSYISFQGIEIVHDNRTRVYTISINKSMLSVAISHHSQILNGIARKIDSYQSSKISIQGDFNWRRFVNADHPQVSFTVNL